MFPYIAQENPAEEDNWFSLITWRTEYLMEICILNLFSCNLFA